jgi:hypothetical protein
VLSDEGVGGGDAPEQPSWAQWASDLWSDGHEDSFVSVPVSESGGGEEGVGAGGGDVGADVHVGDVRAMLPETPLLDDGGGEALAALSVHVPRTHSAASLGGSEGQGRSPDSSVVSPHITESPTTVLPADAVDVSRSKALMCVKATVDIEHVPSQDWVVEEEDGKCGDKMEEDESSNGNEGHEEEAEEEAMTSRQARTYAIIGLVGVYVTWAVFSWCALGLGLGVRAPRCTGS